MHKLAAWAWLISQWSSKLSLTSPRKEGILLERENFGQQKTNISELGWVGHWSVWCSCVCFPTSSDSFQLQIRMCPVPKLLGTVNLQGRDFKVPSGVLLSGKKCCKGSSYSQPLQGFQLLLERLSAPLCPVQKEKRCQLISDGMGLPARQEDFKMPECALS